MQRDWEAIEREFRAGQLSVSEIGRQHGVSHTAINKRAKRDGWTRNLAARVREEVSARLVSEGVSEESLSETVKVAAERGVQVVMGHRTDLARMRGRTVRLGEVVDRVLDAHDAIGRGEPPPDRLEHDLQLLGKQTVFDAVEAVSRTMARLVPLERQAFNLDAATDPTAGDHASLRDLLSDIDGATRGIPTPQGAAD